MLQPINSRCASAMKMIRPLESPAETQPPVFHATDDASFAFHTAITEMIEDPPPGDRVRLGAVEIVWNPYVFPIVPCNLLHAWLLCMPYARVVGTYVGHPYNFSHRCPLAVPISRNYFCQRKLLTMRILWIKPRIEQQEF